MQLMTRLAVACLAVSAAFAETSKVTEHVQVELVEIKVTVSDRQGRPITDIKPEEIRVLEAGKPQELAYFEPMALHGLRQKAGETTTPTPLYSAEGQTTVPDPAAILPPKPVRRIVLAFDPKNSRMHVRDNWRTAAIEWAREKMQPGDQLGAVVLRPHPDWAGPMTDDRNVALYMLDGIDLYTDIPDRNRRNEMTEFVEDMQLCVDNAGRSFGGDDGGRTSDLVRDEVGCAYQLARPLAFGWATESEESVDGMRTLTGQLSAMPGEKIVIYFSEGVIDDAAAIATTAMASVFSYERVDISSMRTRLKNDSLRSLTELHETASAANVAFFTLDTRHASEGGNFAAQLENASRTTTGRATVDPWKDIYDSTSGTLAALAHATGGKPSYGPDNLVNKIEKAAGSFYGIYSLGYYRSDAGAKRGKIKVKIERKKLTVDYDPRPRKKIHRPGAIELDLVVGRPRPVGGDDQALPLALLTPLEQLPLRRGGGGRGCDVGVFVQALSPGGKVMGESFETVTVVIESEQYEKVRTQKWKHLVELDLPPGPMRIRARISDDRQVVLADRSIDLTLGVGEVRGGLHVARVETEQPAATE